ncbi:protein FAM216A [Hyla sarda]|uniref:protein FAM216A n=1 Tax=Hyla sarda TaxID=327740 RepID=UPI0024C300B8|nr:protein FAM216A [Hyla sarda]
MLGEAQEKMDKHTTCTSKRKKISSDEQNQKSLLVRRLDFGHKDLNDGTDDSTSKDSQKGGRLQIVPLRQQIKTVKISRTMKNETFLKHPDLTMGQKRYLCSIARIYSTSNMKALTEKHLHSKIRCGSKKAHLNLPASGKSKNEIKEHCRSVQTETTITETSRTIDEMREKITCLSVNETN